MSTFFIQMLIFLLTAACKILNVACVYFLISADMQPLLYFSYDLSCAIEPPTDGDARLKKKAT